MNPRKAPRLLPLLLALCLAAGCGAEPESSSVPQTIPEPPPESTSQPEPPEPETPPESEALPQEDLEKPGDLAGAEGYYYGGNRLTLYTMEPETGTIRTVRENEFWNGREVESTSPSGRRVLLSSWDGAPSPEVVALSVYDIQRHRLVNLSRTIEAPYGNWSQEHWFPYKWSNGYCFTDEDTILYQAVCDAETPGKPHLHLYDLDDRGREHIITARFLELEAPEPGKDWSAGCIWWAEENVVLGHLPEALGSDWVTWDLETGRLLSRRPGKNGGIPIAATPYRLRDSVLYYTRDDWEREVVELMAYDINRDELTTLAAGPLVLTGEPVPPGEEKGRGYFESTWLDDVGEDGSFVIRSVLEHRGKRAFRRYREAVWSPAAGGEILLGEIQSAPAFPVDAVWDYTPVFAAGPDGRGIFLPLPEALLPEEGYGRPPYLLATLSDGKLLFLAEQYQNTLPQEDPDRWGWLAGAQMYYEGGNRLTLYAMEPETGAIRTVRENEFWNGQEVESISPSGNRVLLSSWDGAPSRRVVALSLYDIGENRLVNLERTIESPYRNDWEESHWFPGHAAGYCFVDENTFCYTRLCFEETPGKGHLHFYDIGEDGRVTARFWSPEYPAPVQKDLHWRLPNCRILPEEGAILCRFLTEERGWEWLTWEIETGKLLSRKPAENGDGGLYRNGVFYYIDQNPEQESFHLVAYRMDTDTKEILATGPMFRAWPGEDWDWSARGAFEDLWLQEVREDGSIVIRTAKSYTEEEYFRDSDHKVLWYEAVWEPSKGKEIRFEEKVVKKTVMKSETGRESGLSISVWLSEDELLLRILPDKMQRSEPFPSPPYILSTLPTGEILFLAA